MVPASYSASGGDASAGGSADSKQGESSNVFNYQSGVPSWVIGAGLAAFFAYLVLSRGKK
jgi:hypothetical protein